MKYKFLCLLIVAISFLSLGNVSAQGHRDQKDWGAAFITSFSFFNGIASGDIVVYRQEGISTKEETVKIPNNIPLVGLSQFMGFRFNPYFMLGLGVGFDFWMSPISKQYNGFVPIYLDMRVNMMNARFTPHWYLNAGYTNRWHVSSKPGKAFHGNTDIYVIQGASSGILIESGLGIHAKVNKSLGIILTFSAKIQESSIKYNNSPESFSSASLPLMTNTFKKNWYYFLGVKAGISF